MRIGVNTRRIESHEKYNQARQLSADVQRDEYLEILAAAARNQRSADVQAGGSVQVDERLSQPAPASPDRAPQALDHE